MQLFSDSFVALLTSPGSLLQTDGLDACSKLSRKIMHPWTLGAAEDRGGFLVRHCLLFTLEKESAALHLVGVSDHWWRQIRSCMEQIKL
jgi:hypothetical protein